jgi:hypothetical protein
VRKPLERQLSEKGGREEERGKGKRHDCKAKRHVRRGRQNR